MDYFEQSLKMHEQMKGKIDFKSKVEINSKEILSTAYSPGVAEPCKQIQKDSLNAYKYTIKSNTIAVISDGSAVLGLGNIGGLASLPVMEGKCVLLKEFAGVNAFPIVLDTQDTEEIINTIKNIAPTVGGINLEDISAPRCFEIEERLKSELDIPVFHDDQHGTAIVTLAGIINSLKVVSKQKESTKIVVNGLGAAGTAIIKLLNNYGFENIVSCDSKGIISKDRVDLNKEKSQILQITNKQNLSGSLSNALVGADIFIGVSVGGALTQQMVKTMAKDPVIFAMANPMPEIMPEDAIEAGAKIIATGRSDYPNQLNNVLVFPGLFAGALKNRVSQITEEHKIKAAEELAKYIKNPSPELIIPSALDKNVAKLISDVIK